VAKVFMQETMHSFFLHPTRQVFNGMLERKTTTLLQVDQTLTKFYLLSNSLKLSGMDHQQERSVSVSKTKQLLHGIVKLETPQTLLRHSRRMFLKLVTQKDALMTLSTLAITRKLSTSIMT